MNNSNVRSVECPVCSFALSGDRFHGYRCAKCRSHFTAKFIARVQRLRLRELIDRHFGEPACAGPILQPGPASQVEFERVIIPDLNRNIEHALAQAKQAARQTTHQLKEFADAAPHTPGTAPDESAAVHSAESEGPDTEAAALASNLASNFASNASSNSEGDITLDVGPAPVQSAAQQISVKEVAGIVCIPVKNVMPRPPGRVIKKFPNPATPPCTKRAVRLASRPKTAPQRSTKRAAAKPASTKTRVATRKVMAKRKATRPARKARAAKTRNAGKAAARKPARSSRRRR